MLQTATTESPLVSLREAGRIAGCDWRTVLRWVETGDVPDLGVRVGGRVMVRRRSLMTLLFSDQAEPTGSAA